MGEPPGPFGADAPPAPAGLTATVSASTVTLTWQGTAVSFVVEAGSRTGSSDLASFDTGSSATSLVVNGVPSGVYYVRVRARNADGVSGASNEVVVSVGAAPGPGPGPCAVAPDAPTGLSFTLAGNTLTLTWTPPAGGCAPTSYILEAGSTPGASDIANADIGLTTTFTRAGVPPGTYYIRVRAANAAGISRASNLVTVFIPSGPINLSGSWFGDIGQVDNFTWQMRLTLAQEGANISGTVRFDSPPGRELATTRFSGTLNGTTLTFSTGQFTDAAGCTRVVTDGSVRVFARDFSGAANMTTAPGCLTRPRPGTVRVSVSAIRQQ